MKDTTKMTMPQMVAEYKKLTGKTIKTTRAVAERRLTGARITIPTRAAIATMPPEDDAPRSNKPSITKGSAVFVGKHQYSSFTAAFRTLKLIDGSMAVLRRVRKELKQNGTATVEGHELRMVTR